MSPAALDKKDSKGRWRRGLATMVPMIVLSLVTATILSLVVQVPTRAFAQVVTSASRVRGFAQALIRFVPTSDHISLPVRVRISISEINPAWAYGSWVVTYHDNGNYGKTYYLAEEFVRGSYRHFGTGFVTPNCPHAMPTAVCVGGFQTRSVVVK